MGEGHAADCCLADQVCCSNSRAVKKMQQNYTKALHQLQDNFIYHLNPMKHLQGYTQSIGFKYIEAFHRLLRSMRDGEVGVNEQIRSLVSTLYDQSPSLMFDDTKVAENTYYVIGFIGFQQLKTTSERQKKGSPVRSILEYICTNHFISPSTAAYKEMIRKIRDEMDVQLVW